MEEPGGRPCEKGSFLGKGLKILIIICNAMGIRIDRTKNNNKLPLNKYVDGPFTLQQYVDNRWMDLLFCVHFRIDEGVHD